jgi:hypothetical protein
MTRVSQSQLVLLSSQLSPRRQQLVGHVAKFRLASGDQLRRLVYPTRDHSAKAEASTARAARLDLAALTHSNCLFRLERRIGGARAGSAGYVYALGAVGRRLVDLWAGHGAGSDLGRSRYEPSIGFQDHALAVTEAIVATSQGAAPLGRAITYRVERAAWRNYRGVGSQLLTLKPDAELAIQDGDFTDHWWLEIDRATERRSVLQRKLGSYLAYYRTGAEQQASGVFPLVAWLTVSEARAAVLREEIANLGEHEQRIFRVGLLAQASQLLLDDGGQR